jgi:thioester reductase-like protein
MESSFRPSEAIEDRVKHLLYGSRKWAAYALLEGGRQGSQVLAHVRAENEADAAKKLHMAYPKTKGFALQEEF